MLLPERERCKVGVVRVSETCAHVLVEGLGTFSVYAVYSFKLLRGEDVRVDLDFGH